MCVEIVLYNVVIESVFSPSNNLNDSINKLAYDIFYIKNKSIFLDLIIFIKTIRVVINFNRYGSN